MALDVLLGLVLLAGALALALAVFVAPARLRLTRLSVRVRDLPDAFDGFRIAVIADVHYGGTLAPGALARRMHALAVAARPHLIVLLGDYGLSYRVAPYATRRLYEWGMRELTPVFRELHAPHGVLAVLGNHDYDYDGERVAKWLASAGARPLRNEAVLIERGDSRLAVAGIDDAKRGTIDPRAGLDGVPADVPRVLLTHNPDGVLRIDRDVRVDLALAGHTHGGQVVIPLLGAPLRHSRICGWRDARGWVKRSPVPLFVSSGVGAMIPLRVACPPEVVVVELGVGSCAGRPGAPAHDPTPG